MQRSHGREFLRFPSLSTLITIKDITLSDRFFAPIFPSIVEIRL